MPNTPHHAVKHPFHAISQESDRFMSWVADKVLPHPIMFYTAIVAPMVVLPMPDWAKAILMIVSGNWIQWWALPALQRRQNELDLKADRKADADHSALTYLANHSDEHSDKLDKIISILLHPSSQKSANE